MLALSAGFTLADLLDLAVFADSAEADLFHVLPLRVAAVGEDGGMTGQLVMLGKPARAMWSLSLQPAAAAADRARLARRLGGGAGPARILSAEAGLEILVTLADGIAARAARKDWRGTAIQLSGEVAGEEAEGLRRAWSDGLPDARCEMRLAVTGTEATVRLDLAQALRAVAMDGAGRSTTTASRRTALTTSAVATGTLTRRFPLSVARDRARATLIETGPS